MTKVRTLLMQAGTGYAFGLRSTTGLVRLVARAECWVRVDNGTGKSPTPTATKQSPAPAAGETTEWAHLLVGDTVDLVADSAPNVHVWAIGAGELRFSTDADG